VIFEKLKNLTFNVMKRAYFLIGSLMAAFTVFGQGVELNEMVVESPRLQIASKDGTIQKFSSNKAAIYAHIQSKLSNPENLNKIDKDGVVVIRFMVEADGTLSQYQVQNSLSEQMDNCVVNCLQETSGQWKPGRVNGEAVPMESKVYVRFVDPDNPSQLEMAKNSVAIAITKFNKGERFENLQVAKKANRQFLRCIDELNVASQYTPDEYTVLFWQACAYEKLGDTANKELRMQQLNKLLAANANQDAIEMAEIIVVKK
jgi:hypothetical protein